MGHNFITRTTLVRIIINALLVCGAVVIAVALFNQFQNRDNQRLTGYKNAAESVGVTRLQQDCKNEGKDEGVCGSISTSVDTTECDGQTCWIVYGQSSSKIGFGASVTLAKHGNKYIVVKYLRNTGI